MSLGRNSPASARAPWDKPRAFPESLRPTFTLSGFILKSAGAGFIGITLKIAWPEAEVTLLESSHRKFLFLNWASAQLKTRGLHAVLGRAPQALHGRTFDAVIIRAVTS